MNTDNKNIMYKLKIVSFNKFSVQFKYVANSFKVLSIEKFEQNKFHFCFTCCKPLDQIAYHQLISYEFLTEVMSINIKV